jgi:hypothetical protein
MKHDSALGVALSSVIRISAGMIAGSREWP